MWKLFSEMRQEFTKLHQVYKFLGLSWVIKEFWVLLGSWILIGSWAFIEFIALVGFWILSASWGPLFRYTLFIKILHKVYLFSEKWQDSEYASGCNYGRVLNIPGFRICQVSAYVSLTKSFEYAWIWLNNARIWQGSEYAWLKFHRLLNVRLVLNIPGLRIWQGCKYVRVTPGTEYALIMPQYTWVCLNLFI